MVFFVVVFVCLFGWFLFWVFFWLVSTLIQFGDKSDILDTSALGGLVDGFHLNSCDFSK